MTFNDDDNYYGKCQLKAQSMVSWKKQTLQLVRHGAEFKSVTQRLGSVVLWDSVVRLGNRYTVEFGTYRPIPAPASLYCMDLGIWGR